MRLLLIISFYIFFSFFLFAEEYKFESYPDYYVKNIKPNVIHKIKKDEIIRRKKIMDFDIGISLTYNKLLEKEISNADDQIMPVINFKKMLSRYNFFTIDFSYLKFKGNRKDNNNSVKNSLFSISSIYSFKPYFFNLPIYTGFGGGLVFCDPDIPNRKVDKSGLFISTELSYLIKNFHYFINYSKSTLQPYDFRNVLSIGMSYYF